MDKVILYANPERDVGLAAASRMRRMLDLLGIQSVVCAQLSELADNAEGADMAVTFGGDGTILHAARAVAGSGVPILGVNMGTVGFIAELEANELELAEAVFKGRYVIENRMMLDISVMRGGSAVCTDFALNDAVVGGVARAINLTLLGDGRRIRTLSGDGVIIATPTGSTAYSMAAGGPIVEPDAENIILTPICAHVLGARAMVLTPRRVVTVELGDLHGKTAYLSVDGGESVPLSGGDRIEIKKSGLITKLVRVTDRSFYDKVSRKLGDKT